MNAVSTRGDGRTAGGSRASREERLAEAGVGRRVASCLEPPLVRPVEVRFRARAHRGRDPANEVFVVFVFPPGLFRETVKAGSIASVEACQVLLAPPGLPLTGARITYASVAS